jgi:hypothetical protein
MVGTYISTPKVIEEKKLQLAVFPAEKVSLPDVDNA